MSGDNSDGVRSPSIELDQVIEGGQTVSRNYRFVQIGQPVPIKPGNEDSQYDSKSPPSKPLAISERFRLLFVAHSNGFYVARTKEVMAVAEDIKDKGNALSSIEELSFLNLAVGKVSVLALSSGDSLLAASVANQLHFYSISALLHKDKEPSFSVCLDDLSCIKDIKWARKAEKNYVVLSSKGKLYHGLGQGSPTNVMDNVDAVEWSAKGALVAVARKNVLSIMSSQFTEKLSFLLSSASVLVDSIRWVRADSMVLGCTEVGDDSEQASYVVYVVTSQDPELTDASSKPVVLSFSDAFLDYRSDVVPGASGPNLFLSYLDHQELAFIANRKNLSQHVVLLGWSLDDKKNEAVTIELSNDVWCAHIESQENGDDNLVLAICVDKVSWNDEMKFILGEEEKEVSPCCVLLCLTIDGKLSLFHFASAAVPSSSPEVSPASDSSEDAVPQVLSEPGLSEISSEIREKNVNVSFGLESDQSSLVEPHRIQGYDFGKENNQQSASIVNNLDNQEQKPPISFKTLKGDNDGIFSGPKPKLNQDRGSQQLVSAEKPLPLSKHSPFKTSHLEVPGIKARDLCKTETQASSEGKPHAGSLLGKVSTDLSSESLTKNLKACGNLEFQEKIVPTDLRITSSSWSTGKSTELTTAEERLSSAASSVFDKKSSGIPDRTILRSAGAPFQPPSHSNETAGHAVQINTSGQKASTVMGDVEQMAAKMDRLLEAIGGEGGFKDASVASQESSLAALEEGLWTISEGCRMWRGVLDERLREIQLLLDKTVQVLVRKTYMKGFFQQASDNWYWDLWNCQKLSSELDLKRQHIMEVDQDLTSQLVELERHFNTIEFNKFGKSAAVQINERTIHSHGNSRQHSLKSLHNTVGAQVAAAEKLSECLWRQMAALSVEPPEKKQSVKRELFETLGLTDDGASYNSPGKGKASDTPRKELLTTSFSVEAKEHSRRNQCTPMKSSESENVRRRRDSLDLKWSRSEPPKTTVKRVLLQEERQGSSASRPPVKVEKQHLKLQPVKESVAASSILSDASAKSSFQQRSNIIAGKQVKQSIEHSVTPFSQWGDGVADPGVQVLTKSSPALLQQSASTASANLSGTRENRTLSGISGSSLPLTSTLESLSGSDSRYVKQSEIHLFDTPSSSERLTSSKNSVEISNNYREVGPSKSTTKEAKHSLVTADISGSDSNSSYKASVSPPASIGSSPNFSQKILHNEITASKSHPGGRMLSSPAMQSISSSTSQFNSSSTMSSSLLKPNTNISSPELLSDKSSSGSEAKIDTDSKTSKPHLLVSSSFTSPFTLSFSTLKMDSLSSATPISMDGSSESLESGPQPPGAVFGSERDGNVMKQPMFSNTTLAMGEIFKKSASVSQTGLNSPPKLHTEPTLPSTPVTELPASLKSDNQLNIGGMSSPATDMAPNAKLEQPWPSRTNSEVAVFSDMSNNGNNGCSAVTNGDEMEEEAPEGSLTTELALGNLGGFGIGSTPNSTVVKPNPFGVEMLNKAAAPLSSAITMSTPSGELFRPASFSFQPSLASQPPQSANIGSFSSGSSTGSTSQGPTASGFGQPAQLGSGQQALGSVLGAFGQSRQLGASQPRSGTAPPSGFTGGFSSMSPGGFGGGFSNVASPGGGFASLATGGGVGGGFAAATMAGGGFGAAATGGGGFAAAATGGGGFGAAATAGGGFGAAATAGGGFGAAATTGGGFGAAATAGTGFSSGGFGAFGNQGGAGFSTFAGGSGAGRPPSELFTQMRK